MSNKFCKIKIYLLFQSSILIRIRNKSFKLNYINLIINNFVKKNKNIGKIGFFPI